MMQTIIYRFGILVLLLSVLVSSAMPELFAEGFEKLDDVGLSGQKPLCVNARPAEPAELYLGTQYGIFKKDARKDESWQKVAGDDFTQAHVYQIVFPVYVAQGYAATSEGLFEIDSDKLTLKKIYTSNRDLEKNCLSVSVDADNNIYVATPGGLFTKPLAGRRWSKCLTGLGEKPVHYVLAAGKTVFVAASDGLYRSVDSGRTWNNVFRLQAQEAEEGISGEDIAEDKETGDRINVIAVPKGALSTVYLGTTLGVFESRDAGQAWAPAALGGLDTKNILDLVCGLRENDIFVVTKTGVFRSGAEGWQSLAPLYDSRRLALAGNELFVLTTLGIYHFEDRELTGSSDQKSGLPSFYEPTIREVQQMVIAYCDVSNKKIDLWHKQARAKALLPDLKFNYGNNVYGSYSGKFAVGPSDWSVSVSWDLADLIYSSDQTSIDVRSRLMVQLRNDVLQEATQLYFERKKLLLELSLRNSSSPQKQLRLDELTALLDRLTGGAFTKVLKSGS